MAKAFIANKPVRFDRNYAVGEIIPADVIAPNMRRKLVEMGRILCVDAPDPVEAPQDGAEKPTDGTEDGDKAITPPDPQNAPEGAQDGAEDTPGATDTDVGSTGDGADEVPDIPGGDIPDAGEDTDVPTTGEYVCPVCGRTFATKNALAAHSRAHKE